MKFETAGLLTRLRAAPAFRNFTWLAADKIVRLVLGVAVGMWVARHLGPADFGVLSYGLAVASLLVVVPSLGLDAIVRRELVRAPAEAGRVLGTTFGLRIVLGVLTYAGLLAGAWLGEPDPNARLALAVAGLTLLQQPFLAIDLWFQSQLLSRHMVIAHNTSFGICSVLRVLFILRGAPVTWFIAVLALETTLTTALLVAAYRRGRHGFADWRWDPALTRRLLRESWPLAVATAASIVCIRIDQVILRAVAGTAETGVYSAAARIMEILHSLPLMLAASLSPGLVAARARSAGDYEQRVRRLFQLAAGSAWGAALGCALLAPWVIPWAFGPAFARTAGILAILAGSLPFIALGVARQEYLINEGRQRFQLATTLVGAVLNVLLNLWAIPRWGGLGAAGATVVSHLTANLLTPLAWPPTRGIGVWQLQALALFWRPPPASRATLAAP